MQQTSRIKASLIHFGLSVSIFSIICLILIELWYPAPYFMASGGWQGLKIAAPIDVVLGPLLTLLVFNPKKSKRELRTDLSIIVCVQMAALIWGVHAIYQQRPVAAVFWENSFNTVAAVELSSQNYPLEKLRAFSQELPALIYAEKPRTFEGLNRLVDNLKKYGISPLHQTEYYRPLIQNFSKILDFRLNIDQVIHAHPGVAEQLDRLTRSGKYQPSELKFFTLKAKYHDMILAFSPSGELVGYLTL